MIFDFIQSKLFWIVLPYFSIILGAAFGREATGNEQLFFQIKQGVRSHSKAFTSLRAKTELDCLFFCLEEKPTCTSLSYAEPTSVNDGEENCELHNETKNDDESSLEFLKDDRYTFYQIPGTSHETEETQKAENATEQIPGASQEPQNAPTTENATEQANTLSLNRSCLDHFNHGSKTTGDYTIFDKKQNPRTVYCDMESEPGSVWTLVMSFTRENKDARSFRSTPLYETASRSPNTPNWTCYRMSIYLMNIIKKTTSHWRVTCSFPEYGVDINKNYVRAAFADFDLTGKFWRECKNVSHISVMGQSCSECTANWSQGNGSTPHIAAVDENDVCDIKSDKSGNTFFGAYEKYSAIFRCTENATSTTNYWFGSYV